MAQLFHPSSKVISRASLLLGVLIIATLTYVSAEMYLSPYFTYQNVPRDQTVPFSHQHHVSGLGIQCQYCHTGAEESNFAAVPPTHTCMTCHSQVWTTSPMLAPVRDSYQNNRPLQWIKVNDLPDFSYFNHSIHVAKGIGCQTCHGDVQIMPLTWRANTLYMGWCLDCHRQPEKYIRPKEEVFNMNYKQPDDQLALGARLVKEYHVNKKQLTDCSVCHR